MSLEAPRTIYVATLLERELATAWHGGMSSSLYAVSSTGRLERGTIRPAGADSDAKWSYWILEGLQRELRLLRARIRDASATMAETSDSRTAYAWLLKLEPIGVALEELIDREEYELELERNAIRGVCDICGETVTLDPTYASGWRHDPAALHGARVTRGMAT